MIKVKSVGVDDIKTSFIEAPDVEYTKRGLLQVHIKQEYDGKSTEYDTFFSANTSKKEGDDK